ncbi:sushi, von Willebrand factor type A, EGF and pentraxin domain-containing protein 1-like [Dreissena polymorpha]|uniref:Uncharacterized protein n=1 Tax=Dreissena polymorpha TaxID=45954 RepID=A0A9D4N6H0_DREPO|nr:sushi, von Willebrand factor type A, EGF and pentraxin domain-containing protein 1-like [Dreissena polymorpha]KAH3888655.1 hypothetical protein DPMN_012695 [Dreissena polymorpha]
MLKTRDVILSCVFVVHVVLSGRAPAVGTDPSECRSLMDMYFVIDGSDSISAPDFVTLKRAMAGMVPQIDLGQNKARIGMLVYSSNVPVMSKHSFSYDAGYLMNAANTLEHPRDGTNTALAIKEMTEIFKANGRPNVPWTCVVITDGISKDPFQTMQEAKKAELMGINMFAVGVGHLIAREELTNIASTQLQVMTIDNFSQLKDKLASMMTTICPCPIPPVVTYAKCSDGARAIGTVRQYQCLDGYLQRGNGAITCQNDFTWTHLATDFECVPCSDQTPVVQHGTCGGGDVLIGSTRLFTCAPGYLAVGNPMITCNPMAQWTVPDFKCIPCGETPTIPYGTCGGGDHTLGATRMFTCEPGYLAVGNPMITCNPQAQWTIPEFKCIPCGETPVIPFGSCDGGDFKIGATRKFTCHSGYLGIGDPMITCDHQAKWTQPSYKCVPCGDTPTIPHGTCGGGDYTIGATRAFTCNTGYLAVGNPMITCNPLAQWTLPDFKCIPCGETPTIPYGTCGGGDYTLGATRMFTCAPGYLAVGNPMITCNPQAQWTLPDFKCIPCGEPPTIPYGTCGGGDYTLGATRMFTCEPGYLAVGNPMITCNPEAQWTLPDFKCIPCGETPTIPHGTCDGGDYKIGATRKFTCENGYLAVGNPLITCNDAAQWTAPNFQCIPCGDTPVIPYGSCDGGDYKIGAIRRYTCAAGYLAVGEPSITCNAQAQWTMPQIKCLPCGPTPQIPNGICEDGDYRLGSKRTFKCEPGYFAVGNNVIECNANALWTPVDFQCIPCGPTPVISHGQCGGGEFTIGSRRALTCDVGYLAVGDPYIQCLDNAQWSALNFMCKACGDTPLVANGECGGGDYTIGANRLFSCLPGYKAVGTAGIVCRNDATWSVPDFKCVPCGATPDVEHGTCGGGDYTIGAKRAYTCAEGYLLVGKPDIECTADAVWSTPSFKCTPCGETPVVMNANCGSGSHLINSERKYACHTGYIAKGDPHITCLSSASWSVPTFQCLDCGPVPVVANAYAGLGSATVGSKATYVCNQGYTMSGQGESVCLNSGQWSKPTFTCEVKVAPVPVYIPIAVDPTVCDACRYINGVGYNRHPTDCNQYVQCFVGAKGLEPVYRRCPFGLFWDQNVLTCRPADQVDCPNDQCKISGMKVYKHTDPDNCCAYWKCQNQRSFGECCGEGFSFDASAQMCVRNFACTATCPYKDEIPACDKRPAASETMYQQHIGNNFWVDMPCAPGTAFHPLDCGCSLLLMTLPGKTRQQVCKPELYMPFTNGLDDRSGRNVYVLPENVSVSDGAAMFNGHSRILVNRFANTEFFGNLVIKFRYNEFKTGSYYQQLQALVTNGDCGADPSIVIAKMPNFVLIGAKTDKPKSLALPTTDKVWKEVIYIHDEKKLEGKVCGASFNKWSVGPIQATHCALQIGRGTGLTSYHGLMDDLYVYQCRPREDILNIDY